MNVKSQTKKLCQLHDKLLEILFIRSLRQMIRGGVQINYREEEKKILDSILGKDVYDNRIRPSGHNGTGKEK